MSDPVKARAKERGYNRDYYETNKARIAARKKARYDNDPEYRESVLQRRAEQRIKEKVARAKAKEKAIPYSKRSRIMQVVMDGETYNLDMLTTAQLADRLKMSAQSLRLWEQRGLLPQPTFRTTSNNRLYSEQQATAMSTTLEKWKASMKHWRITPEFTLAFHEAFDTAHDALKAEGGYDEQDED